MVIQELFSDKVQSIKLSQYFDPKAICFFSAKNRNEAIKLLVNKLVDIGKIPDKTSFLQAIFKRENILSTGIGMGVAIPHAKQDILKDFFVAIGIQKNKALEWDAIDKAPVRLIFLIGGPEDKQAQYLEILSGLTMIIKDENLRRKIFHHSSPREIFNLLTM